MARVLVVTVAHTPSDARIFHRQIAALREFGHEVTFAAPFTAFAQPRPAGLRTVDLPRSSGNPLRRLPALASATRLLVRERGRHDVVLVHDPELLPALAVAGLSRRPPVRVWDVHEDVPAQVAMLPIPQRLKRPVAGFVRGVESLAERYVHLIVAESAYLERFRATHPFVPNSVRVPPGGPWPVDDPLRVVYLGNLTWKRGARELIELAALLPEIRVQLIGIATPDVAVALEAAQRETPNLDVEGFVPNDVALGRLPGALAGLSLLHDEPNYAHSQPTKIMEYMAHGVPSITTPNPASKALVEAGQLGAVVDFGDVAAAAAVVRQWAADPTRRAWLGRNAYAEARQHDWSTDGRAFSETLDCWVEGASDRERRS